MWHQNHVFDSSRPNTQISTIILIVSLSPNHRFYTQFPLFLCFYLLKDLHLSFYESGFVYFPSLIHSMKSRFIEKNKTWVLSFSLSTLKNRFQRIDESISSIWRNRFQIINFTERQAFLTYRLGKNRKNHTTSGGGAMWEIEGASRVKRVFFFILLQSAMFFLWTESAQKRGSNQHFGPSPRL